MIETNIGNATATGRTARREATALDGHIEHQRLHRYALSMELAAGKAVLVLSSGEGYGAALLAQVAGSSTGFDASREAVEHARRKYCRRNLSFLAGDYDALPLADASVDVVTSFEAAGDLDERAETLREIKRVLRPDGVLVISSAKRASDAANGCQSFHDSLGRYFKHVHVYGQRLTAGSVIYPLKATRAHNLKTYTNADAGHPTPQASHTPAPDCLVAVCSDDAGVEETLAASVYIGDQIDSSRVPEGAGDGLLKHTQKNPLHIETLKQHQTRLEQEMRAQAQQLSTYEAQLRRQAEELAEKQAKVLEQDVRVNQQAVEISRMHAQLSSYRTQFNQLAYMLSEARVQLANKKALLSWMIQSRSWKLTSALRSASLLSSKLRQRIPRVGRNVFRGRIDSPKDGDTASGYLEVVGWAYSTAAPVVRVEAFLDNMPLSAVRYGHARPDVAGSHPSEAPVDCGYANRLPLDQLLTGHRTLMIRVTDEHGNFQDYTRAVFINPMAEQTIPEIALSVAAEAGETSEEMVASFLGDNLSSSKKLLTSMANISLDNFLLSDAVIEIPQYENPEVSIVLVLYNRAELTLQCLYSILKSHNVSFEIILVDNASTDETRFLLKRIKGAQIVENGKNFHFLLACNQAARRARGEHILLLNNDTQILADSVSAALRTLKSDADIGAVGGKIILPDGTLQEAGSIVWQDGSCVGYGRGDSPSAPAYMFRRDVDYCSAAFLLTRRDLFLEAGGFDEDYAPAYYEETDYCARLWKKGKRVVYDPNVIVLHYEFASSGSYQSAIGLQIEHRRIFVEKHREWLQAKHVGASRNILSARSAGRQKHILFIDDRVPHVNLGSGFPRSNRILKELIKLGHSVTFYPLSLPKEDWGRVYEDLPREVEVMIGYGVQRLDEFLSERSRFYDTIFVSRPHNMAALKELLAKKPHLCPETKIVYDAEALFSLRDISKARLRGEKLSTEEQEKLINEEMRLAEGCHCIISVSERESREFVQYGFERVYTLGHSIPAAPTPRDFDERSDILFVGSMPSLTSPNADSMIWFTEKIFPLIRQQLGDDIKLNIVGPVGLSLRNRFAGEGIRVWGRVEDLTDLYDRTRLFIAPTRFSAGIPHKAHEAAAHGLPLVATTLIGAQLGWQHDEELLLADDAADFASACVKLYQDGALWKRLRQNALKRIETDCSPELFSERLKTIVG